MAGMRLKHVERFKDRHGRVRWYFRKGHGKRISLDGEPGSAEFRASYEIAAGGNHRIVGAQPAPGSMKELILAYLASPDFIRLAPSSQRQTRGILEAFGAEHGHAPYTTFKRSHLDVILAKKSATPGAANNMLKKLRVVIKFALARGMLDRDPTAGVRRFAEGEYHTWTEAEIETFETRWSLGTMQRTAFALHIYTGQRRADVCRMQWSDIERDLIHVVQGKTGARLAIPIHQNLRRALTATPKRGLFIIATQFSLQRSEKAYGGYMADAIDAAKLPTRCVLHGLRKAAARRLAEAGCTVHQIMAITGHKTLEEVARYTRAAEQEGLARSAIGALKPGLGRRQKAK